MKMITRIGVIFLALMLMLTSIPYTSEIAYAFTVGDVTVNRIRYTNEHNGFNTSSAYIEIFGTGLSGIEVLFDKKTAPAGYGELGVKTIDSATFVKYVFSSSEAQSLTGKVLIEGVEVDLGISSFPNIDGSNKRDINMSLYDLGNDADPNNLLELTGANLDEIMTDPNISAEYGRIQTEPITDAGPNTIVADKITLVRPPAPGGRGYQSIRVSKVLSGVGYDPDIEVNFLYANAFRLVENIGLTNLRMYPNTGGKDDTVYFTADNFSNSKTYAVHFLKALDGTDDFTDDNKAEHVGLALNVNGNEDILTVKVPDAASFELRDYNVVITEVLDGEVIAEQIVRNQSDTANDIFSVVGTQFKPTLDQVFPNKGPDTGGTTELQGKNIITLNIPNLSGTTGVPQTLTGSDGDTTLTIDYGQGTYKTQTVDIEREITIQIGKKTSFAKDDGGAFRVVQDNPDRLILNTPIIDDAETDPQKDVVVEIKTTLKEQLPSTKEYVFTQIVTLPNGYTYEPSSYSPIIDSITPELMEVEVDGAYFKWKSDILMSINGGNYLVEKTVDDSGQVIFKKPSVLFKKDDDNTDPSTYQIAFYPNEVTTLGGTEVRGVIRYKNDEKLAPSTILVDGGGNPVPFEITVLNDANQVVDGTEGNQIGTKIVVVIPDVSQIKDAGLKHVQVTNPRRGSDSFGKSTLVSDVLTLVDTNDSPVIEKVKPSVVTLDGGVEIVVTGNNFQEGMKLYLDGNEITGFTRESDVTGTKIELKFQAPVGREGTTQILVVNPAGGTDVAEFTYVKKLNDSPIINSFSPPRGPVETLVLINGDNFVKGDPTIPNLVGVNINRILGSRVFLDDKDVNSYNTTPQGTIEFLDYTAPATEALLKQVANKATYSKFKDNVFVTSGSAGEVITVSNDDVNNPKFITDTTEFTFKYEGGGFKAYQGLTGSATDVTVTHNAGNGETTIAITGGPTFISHMDNKLVTPALGPGRSEIAKLADYGESVILYDAANEDYFLISTNFENEVMLTNGSSKTYRLEFKSATEVEAIDTLSNVHSVVVNDGNLVIDGTVTLTIKTPYTIDGADGRIVGDVTRVISKEQMSFKVPYLSTGTGYKDLAVVNPDTAQFLKEDEEGFYYISHTSSHPVITTVDPSKGSISGGYYVRIDGKGFEDGASVFLDSVLVPSGDTFVALDGSYIIFKAPASIKDLSGDFGVDQFDVPILVMNQDGGNAYREKGFTYIIPNSSPQINTIIPNTGSSNGGDIVEIIGYEFRFYEPYENVEGGPGYDPGTADTFTDLNKNGKWDDLLDPVTAAAVIERVDFNANDQFPQYLKSEVLPSVFFGEVEAKIVEFTNGYLKVIAPAHAEGNLDVYVINNDSGVSNHVNYSYVASNPSITQINPNKGTKAGQEPKDIFGSAFAKAFPNGYVATNTSTIVQLSDVQSYVKFGEVDNLNIDRIAPNSGLINSQRTTVNLAGGLSVSYYGDLNEVRFTLTENGVTYNKTFSNYEDQDVLVPMGALQSGAGNYYVPNGYDEPVDATNFVRPFEHVRVKIEDRRMLVERGYSPKATFDNSGHIIAYTPSYYTIDPVPVRVTNPDTGSATAQFTYTNPASKPKIFLAEPKTIPSGVSEYWVQGSANGGIDIEIWGEDFRDDIKVYVGTYQATVQDLTVKEHNGVIYDVIVARIPSASVEDYDIKLPIIVENTDSAIANSTNPDNLVGPNSGTETWPIYFIYRKPLSGPEVESITPNETSRFGGNPIVIKGRDFRAGSYVVIGSLNGIPVTNVTIENDGTVLKFITPNNLSVGDKTVYVLNQDFGTAVVDNGLKIVSYPTVESTIYNEQMQSMSRISVEGGQKIVIKGTDFHDGAQVYFGGEWTKAAVDNSDTSLGIYKNDNKYYVKDGVAASAVQFVDENTLIVTTPKYDKEGDVNIVVRNSDKGISENNAVLTYTLPVPGDPTGLKATIVDDRYIKLYDYTAADVSFFDIYVYIGNKDSGQLITNAHRDFAFLGSTEIEPYKITTLPGFENILQSDKIWFVVKGVNKYGASSWSNLAYLTYEDFKDVDFLGPPDLDGELGVPKGQDYVTEIKDNQVDVTISKEALPPKLTINASSAGGDTFLVNVPEEQLNQSFTNIVVSFNDMTMQFVPVVLNTTTMKNMAYYEEAYSRIKARLNEDGQTTVFTSQLPRGKKKISEVLRLEFSAVSNARTDSYDFLSGQMDIQFAYESTATMAEELSLQLYKYNENLATWEPYTHQVNTANNTVSARISEGGIFIILSDY